MVYEGTERGRGGGGRERGRERERVVRRNARRTDGECTREFLSAEISIIIVTG